MIHRIKDEEGTRYVISSHDVWRPGCYESKRAARYAFRFDDEVLQRLQESVNPGGVITMKMLRETRAAALRREGEKS